MIEWKIRQNSAFDFQIQRFCFAWRYILLKIIILASWESILFAFNEPHMSLIVIIVGSTISNMV